MEEFQLDLEKLRLSQNFSEMVGVKKAKQEPTCQDLTSEDIREITKGMAKDLSDALAESVKPHIFYFTSPDSDQCQQIDEYMEQQHLPFLKIRIKTPDAVTRYDIKDCPTPRLQKGEKILQERVGGIDLDALDKMLKRWAKSKVVDRDQGERKDTPPPQQLPVNQRWPPQR